MMKNILSILYISLSVFSFAQWETMQTSTSTLQSVYHVNSSLAFAGGIGEVYKSTDGGDSWQNLTYGIQYLYLAGNVFADIHAKDATTITTIGWHYPTDGGSVIQSTDGGVNWVVTYTGSEGTSLRAASFPSNMVGYACGDNGTIIKTTNGGTSWSPLLPGTSIDLRDIHFTDVNNGFVVGDSVFLKTSDGGTTWSTFMLPYSFLSVQFLNTNLGYAGGINQTMLKTTNGGNDWEVLEVPVYEVNDIEVINENTAWIGTNYGVYKTENGGVFWGIQPSIDSTYIFDLSFQTPSNALAVGYSDFPNGQIYRTTNGGDQMIQYDAAIIEIEDFAYSNCPGAYDLKVTLANLGATELTSVDIPWSLDGVIQGVYQWSGNIAPGDTMYNLVLAPVSFGLKSVNIQVWTDKPNGLVDEVLNNDSASYEYSARRLSGTYTIGGIDGDFESINDAVSRLRQGTCGPVTFNIRPGVYNEQIQTTSIYYRLPHDHPVTFQSETGIAGDVEIKASGSYNKNYVWSISGIDHFFLKNITFTAENSTYGKCVVIKDQADSVTIDGCVFNGIENSNSTNTILLSNEGDNENYLTLINCRYNYGYGAINLKGDSYQSKEKGLIIADNVFNEQYETSVTINYGSAIEIYNNQIKKTTLTNSNGIFMNACDSSLLVYRNIIKIGKGVGINIKDCNPGKYSNALVYNNVCQVGAASTSTGFSISGSTNFGIYHNSFVSSSESTFGYSARLYNGNDIDFRNNIVANYGNGSGLDISDTAAIKYCDYNLIYSNGERIVNFETRIQSIEAWRSQLELDVHSVIVDPQWNNEDWHIRLNLSNYKINGSGTPIPSVVVDLDGEPRNTTTPDIGADEFDIPIVDATLSKVIVNPFVCGNSEVKAILKNLGTNNLTSAIIMLSLNGQNQPISQWTGNLASGKSDTISLGESLFSADSTLIVAWVSNPNGLSDPIAVNDTSEERTYFLQEAMSGVFTVGGNNPDYEVLDSAIAHLEKRGVCGPVTLSLRDGTYFSESLVINEIPGTSYVNSITLKSEAENAENVTIEGDRFGLKLNGVNYLYFEDLTFSFTYWSGRAIEITEATHGLSMKGCVIKGKTRDAVYASDVDLSNIFFEGCTFEGGSVSLDGHWDHLMKNVQFINNKFYGQVSKDAISLNFHVASKIDGNQFVIPNTDYRNAAISMGSSYGDIQIVNNTFDSIQSGSPISLTNVYGYNDRRVLIANNIINCANGISVFEAKNVNVFHNTIAGTGQALTVTQSSNVTVKNNILTTLTRNERLNGIVYYTQNSGLISDYNCFFGEGDDLFGYAPGSYMDELYSWQKEINDDYHSVFRNPEFISSLDLHLNNDAVLASSGSQLDKVLFDIDNDLRSPTPSIGADEIIHNKSGNDIGVLLIERPDSCTGTSSVAVRLKNYGSSPVTSVSIGWSVNGVIQNDYGWSGTLGVGVTSSPIEIGVFDFFSFDTLNISAWTNIPNNTPDTDVRNDTFNLYYFHPAFNGVYSVGEQGDFPTISRAVEAIEKAGVCGAVIFNILPGLYEEQVSIHEIPGVNESDTIIIQSLDRDTSSVQIVMNGPQDYTFGLLGADHITIRDLTIAKYRWQDHTALQLSNRANHNHIWNNHFIGSVTDHGDGYDDYFSVVRLKDGPNSYNDIVGNTVHYSTYGITADGTFDRNNIVKNNQLIDQYDTGIDLSGQRGVIIENNHVETIRSARSYTGYGIRLRSSSGTNMVRNNYVNGFYDHGIDVRGVRSYGADTNWVYNNMISRTLVYGVNVEFSNNVKIVHNNVYLGTSWKDGAAVHTDYDSLILIRNNIGYNYNKGYGLFVEDDPERDLITFDHNNWYAPIESFVKINRTDFTTIQELKDVTGQATGSMAINPRFVANNDVHILNDTLASKGLAIAQVNTDFDGDPRPITRPTIGADEGVFFDFDASVISIDQVTNQCEGATAKIYVTIRNLGLQNITNAVINWSANGVLQSPFNWAGNLNTAENTFSTEIGVLNFTDEDQVIKVWIASVNGVNDENPVNDTTLSDLLVPSMDGTYVIGNSQGDFASLQEALHAMEKRGACGTVELSIAEGTYNEQVIINPIQGINRNNRLIINSQRKDSTTVTIQYAATNEDSNYVIQVATNYVTIENITVRSLGSTYNSVIDIKGGTQYLIVQNNYISAPISDSLKWNYLIGSTGSSSYTRNNLYEQNYLQGGDIAFRSSRENKTIFRGNVLVDQYYYGILTSVVDEFDFVSNSITSSVENQERYKALVVDVSSQDVTILKNTIFGISGDGISIEASNGMVANNFVQVYQRDDSNYGSNGIVLDRTRFSNIYHNTIVISAPKSATSVPSYAVYGDRISVVDIKNNIIVNRAGDYCFYFSSNYNNFTSDYNILFSDGGGVLMKSSDNFNYHTLSALQLDGLELNSLNADPIFFGQEDLHLHIANAIGIDNKGVVLAEVLEDIDGEIRSSTTPDIGADEFDLTISGNEDNNLHMKEIEIVPNPASDYFIIYNKGKSVINFYRLMDLQGLEKYSDNMKEIEKQITIDISSLSQGVYILELFTNEGRFLQRVVVQ